MALGFSPVCSLEQTLVTICHLSPSRELGITSSFKRSQALIHALILFLLLSFLLHIYHRWPSSYSILQTPAKHAFRQMEATLQHHQSVTWDKSCSERMHEHELNWLPCTRNYLSNLQDNYLPGLSDHFLYPQHPCTLQFQEHTNTPYFVRLEFCYIQSCRVNFVFALPLSIIILKYSVPITPSILFFIIVTFVV